MTTKLLAALGLLLLLPHLQAGESIGSERLDFAFEGRRLSGVLDRPAGRPASGIVILVHGHGQTNAVAGKWYRDLRSRFAEMGLASYVWDKAGCGQSEGTYDHNQSVQSSAREVLAAIGELKRRDVAGSGHIGLWGISRAGWICPLVIEEMPSIAFWISVSGTDDKESFGYLLEANLRIEGRNEAEARALAAEWRRGGALFRKGGTWAEYLRATENLRRDPFYDAFFHEDGTEEGYRANQRRFMAENHPLDEASGLAIYVPQFRETLSKIRCPVLALFGEKDSIVDWRRTLALYQETMGRSEGALLTVKTFPGCNHNLQQCQTGGFRETRTSPPQPACEGYLDTISAWIKAKGLATAAKSRAPLHRRSR